MNSLGIGVQMVGVEHIGVERIGVEEVRTSVPT
jgi:hypothetical protein